MAEVRKTIRNTAAADGVQVEISLPQDPGQAGKVQPATWWQWLAGYVVRAGPETGDKYTRAQPMAAQAAAGNVRLVQGDWTVVATLWWSFSSSANRRASLAHAFQSVPMFRRKGMPAPVAAILLWIGG